MAAMYQVTSGYEAIFQLIRNNPGKHVTHLIYMRLLLKIVVAEQLKRPQIFAFGNHLNNCSRSWRGSSWFLEVATDVDEAPTDISIDK